MCILSSPKKHICRDKTSCKHSWLVSCLRTFQIWCSAIFRSCYRLQKKMCTSVPCRIFRRCLNGNIHTLGILFCDNESFFWYPQTSRSWKCTFQTTSCVCAVVVMVWWLRLLASFTHLIFLLPTQWKLIRYTERFFLFLGVLPAEFLTSLPRIMEFPDLYQ